MVNGIASACSLTLGSVVPIAIERPEEYRIYNSRIERRAPINEPLTQYSEKIVKVFHDLEVETNKNGIDIDETFCDTTLKELALYGHRAYKAFFAGKDRRGKEAWSILSDCIKAVKKQVLPDPTLPAPTFISGIMNFPWEAFYEGDPDEITWKKLCESEPTESEYVQFWGLKYSPARILDYRNVPEYISEQAIESDMLFCLHRGLRHAYEHEWPRIEEIVRARETGRFCLLGLHPLPKPITSGKDLLIYFGNAEHNMVHFACDNKQAGKGTDVLRLTLMGKEDDDMGTQEIKLEPDTFLDVSEKFTSFKRKPLIFLNACKTGGGSDGLRATFNLSEKFIEYDAGALIATSCTVPDSFAAAFARQFYIHFLQERKTIGEALHATRWHFLKYHKNPLGLAYGLYSPAHYRLAQPPAQPIQNLLVQPPAQLIEKGFSTFDE